MLQKKGGEELIKVHQVSHLDSHKSDQYPYQKCAWISMILSKRNEKEEREIATINNYDYGVKTHTETHTLQRKRTSFR
jgi:hypothetical protein